MKRLYSVICADIVNSTSLDINAMIDLRKMLDDTFYDIRNYLGVDFWGRLVKGDSIECCIETPEIALRIAMILKCRCKWWAEAFDYGDGKLKTYGLRFSIGVGAMRIIDPSRDIMDGEAIYSAGRGLSFIEADNSTSTFSFVGADLGINELIRSNVRFIDNHLNSMSARQCAVIYYKLLGLLEKNICEILHLSQPAVNLRAKGASWHLLNNTLRIIESLDYGRYLL